MHTLHMCDTYVDHIYCTITLTETLPHGQRSASISSWERKKEKTVKEIVKIKLRLPHFAVLSSTKNYQ